MGYGTGLNMLAGHIGPSNIGTAYAGRMEFRLGGTSNSMTTGTLKIYW